MAVDRCHCLDLTFEALKKLAEERGLDARGLRDLTGCAGGCGLCLPYIKIMLRTGQTDLPVMDPVPPRDAVRNPVDAQGRS